MDIRQNVLEQQYWTSFQEGDDSAIAILYNIYCEALYNYGMKFCENEDVVRDALQDLFIKLIRSRTRIAVPQFVKKYLFAAFKSMLIDNLRKQKQRYTRFPITEYNTDDFELKVLPVSFDVTSSDYTEKLNKSLQSLTPRQREVVFLLYYENFSYEEVAKMLKMSRKGAYKLAARAIQVLRNSLLLFGIHIYLFYKYFC